MPSRLQAEGSAPAPVVPPSTRPALGEGDATATVVNGTRLEPAARTANAERVGLIVSPTRASHFQP